MHVERLVMYDYHDCAYYWARHLRRKSRKGSKSTRLRRVVFVRDGFTCQNEDCGRIFKVSEKWNGEHIPGLSLGHVIPKAQGGGRTISNLRAQCLSCNNKLGNKVWESEVGRY